MFQGELDKDFFPALKRDIERMARQTADVHAHRAVELAVEESPELTGELKRRTQSRKVGVPDGYLRVIFTNVFYDLFVHEGTGLFGPLKRRIVPKTKRVLRWLNGAGVAVFARSTKGQRPNRFMDRAFKRLLGESERLIDRLWERF